MRVAFGGGEEEVVERVGEDGVEEGEEVRVEISRDEGEGGDGGEGEVGEEEFEVGRFDFFEGEGVEEGEGGLGEEGGGLEGGFDTGFEGEEAEG